MREEQLVLASHHLLLLLPLQDESTQGRLLREHRAVPEALGHVLERAAAEGEVGKCGKCMRREYTWGEEVRMRSERGASKEGGSGVLT